MFSLSLTLHSLPTSLNKSLRTHRFQYQKKNRGWDNLIWLESRLKAPPAPLERARISIVRHSHRMLDFDGLVGSMKPVVDGLVSAGILIDDRWSVTGIWHVDQKFRPKKDGPLLEISIQELPNDIKA